MHPFDIQWHILAKVGVEGSNPFARSNSIKALGRASLARLAARVTKGRLMPALRPMRAGPCIRAQAWLRIHYNLSKRGAPAVARAVTCIICALRAAGRKDLPSFFEHTRAQNEQYKC